MTEPTRTTQPTASLDDRPAGKILSMIAGIVALLILLQGVWAGIFLGHHGGPWKDIHGGLGELATLIAIGGFVFALLKLKHRRDVVTGTAVLAVLMILAVGAGMAGKGGLVVHLPLALASMAVAAWLPTRLR